MTWPVTIIGTILIVLGWIGGQQYLRHYPIEWRSKNGITYVKRLNIGYVLPLAGMVILLWIPHLPLLTSILFHTSVSVPFSAAKPGELLVIIAPFDGNEDLRPEARIENRLIKELAKLPELTDVRVERYHEPITEKNNKSILEYIKTTYQPSIVVWGWYDAIGITTAFEIMQPVEFYGVKNFEPTSEEMLRLSSEPDKFTFYVARDLPQEMTYLALFTIGQIYISKRDYKLSQEYLEAAIANLPDTSNSRQEDTIYYVLAAVRAIGYTDFEYGIQITTRLIDKVPEDVTNYSLRAAFYEYKEATKYLKKNGIPFTYDITLVDGVQGLMLSAAKEIPPEAIKSWEALQDYNYFLQHARSGRELPGLYFRRGIQNYAFGNLEQAISDMKEAVKGLPPGYFQDQAKEYIVSWSEELSP